ncbi:serine/threonine-protein kinase [Streptomyces sp. NPDC017964]|uniref:serine/threonine-protein kinase n=1 Tax=Streptomyces sp. NPDC017964 TaxID=3365022 RepID=UPI00378E1BE3
MPSRPSPGDLPPVSVIVPPLSGDPRRIASYRVVGRLGSGGMGTVYAATDPGGRRVAVKVINAQYAADPQFRARFQREVAALRRVDGPHLVPLLDADLEADVPWLATEYVNGRTLHDHLAVHGPVAGIHLHLLAAGTAGALAAIQAAGVIHRDIKPTNVILSPQGPRVLDFGIAHIADGTAVTRTGITTGTPGWISPEHYRGDAVGAPGDVFAWGALIAYAATGRLPFGTGAPDAVAFRVMRERPDLGGIPNELRGLVELCLEKEPVRRPTAQILAEQTTDLLSRQATQVLDNAPGHSTLVQDAMCGQWHIPTVGDDPAWSAGRVRNRRKRAAWLSATALLAFAAVGFGSWSVIHPHAPRTRIGATPMSPTTSPPTNSSPAETSPSPTRTVHAVSSPSTAPSPSATLTRTQVNTIAPWAVGGYPADDITVTGETIGSCWSSSEATMRLDAWRCTAESVVLDPCFAPDESPEQEALLCMGTQPNRMVRLTLSEPLPGNNFHIPGGPTINPIIVILPDENTCRVMTGATTVLAGERMNYSCEGGGYLYGDPDKSDPLWTISYSSDKAGASISTPIDAVYQ